MKRQTAITERHFFRQRLFAGFALLIFAAACGGCALFGAEEFAPSKNKNLVYDVPPGPFARTEVSSADRVWQSTATGNTIAMNSGCSEAEVKEFKAKEFLSGLDDLTIKGQSKFSVDQVSGDRIRAAGTADNVPIIVDLITYKKGECTYDLAYVSRASTYANEIKIFEDFVRSFHAP